MITSALINTTYAKESFMSLQPQRRPSHFFCADCHVYVWIATSQANRNVRIGRFTIPLNSDIAPILDSGNIEKFIYISEKCAIKSAISLRCMFLGGLVRWGIR